MSRYFFSFFLFISSPIRDIAFLGQMCKELFIGFLFISRNFQMIFNWWQNFKNLVQITLRLRYNSSRNIFEYIRLNREIYICPG